MTAPPFAESTALNKSSRIVHGFFGRLGGNSSGPFASLNMSESSGDELTLVARNRAQALESLGRPPTSLVSLRQVHSTRVVTLDSLPDLGEPPTADAVVTRLKGVCLSILTADCAPVLLADPDSGVIAAAHAGWKGAAGGILRETINAMKDLGATPGRIRAAIGPTISGANYEIGPETAAAIIALDPIASAHVFVPDGHTREHFDIPGLLRDQLAALGVGAIDDLALCTYADPARWFSHRYATHHGTIAGRQMSLIALV
jgi:YfiH family protein